MVEILIQRKRRRRVWPWLLGGLVLVLVPLSFLSDRDQAPAAREGTARRDTVPRRDTTILRGPAPQAPGGSGRGLASETPPRTTTTAAGAIAPAPAVPTAPGAGTPAATNPAPTASAFERFIAAARPNPNERAQRRYTADGLRRLADELRALGASDEGVRAIRANADSLQMASARSDALPDHVRAAFLAAVRELDVLRARHGVAVDTGRLRSTAWAITPRQRLLPQRGTIQTFFESARDALGLLSRRR